LSGNVAKKHHNNFGLSPKSFKSSAKYTFAASGYNFNPPDCITYLVINILYFLYNHNITKNITLEPQNSFIKIKKYTLTVYFFIRGESGTMLELF